MSYFEMKKAVKMAISQEDDRELEALKFVNVGWFYDIIEELAEEANAL